jgi:hypothetical protein
VLMAAVGEICLVQCSGWNRDATRLSRRGCDFLEIDLAE